MAQHFDIAPYQESGYKAALRAVARARRDAQKQGIDLGIPGEGSTADALKAQMGSRSLVGRYLSSGGLGNAAQGLGSVPRGANFGTAFLAAAGGAGRAYGASQIKAQELAAAAAKDKSLNDYRATTSNREQAALDETIRNHGVTEGLAAQKPVGPRAFGEQPWYNDPSVANTPGAKAARKKAETLTGGDTETLSPAALDMTAEVYYKTGLLPAMGMKASKVRKQILDRAAALHPGADVAGNKAAYGADQKSLSGIQGQLDQTVGFGNTLEKNAQPLEQMIATIPNLGTKFGNHVGRWAASQAGSPQVAQFHSQMKIVRAEAQRILQFAGTGGNAALTDTQAREMHSILGDDFTPAQLHAVLTTLRQDKANKIESYGAQIEAIKGRIHGAGGQSQGQPQGGGSANDPLGIR